MEWHLRGNSDDFIVPDCLNMYEDTHIEDVAPSRDAWSQRRVSQTKDMGLLNEYYVMSDFPSVEEMDFSQLPCGQLSRIPHEYQGASICGQPSLTDCSASDSKPSVSSQFDLDMENEMEDMDDIFSNSFLEDEQMFPDSMYRPLPFEDLLSAVDADSHNWLDSSNWGISPPSSFSSLLGHEMEDCNRNEDSSPYSTPKDSERSEGSPTDNVLCAMDDIDAVSDVDEPIKCFEETALLELGDVMLQLTEKTRICFRDALYRFAKTSEQKHITCHNKQQEDITCHSKHVSCSDNPPTCQTISESSRNAGSNCLESSTSAIDRMVANLMYNKAYCDPSEL